MLTGARELEGLSGGVGEAQCRGVCQMLSEELAEKVETESDRGGEKQMSR